jgi:mono/diheme cytochrome c family protein
MELLMRRDLVFLVRWLVVGGLLFPVISKAADFVFKLRGKIVKTLTLEDLKKITPPKDIEVLEMHENKQVVYKALDFSTVLKSVYGESWKKNDEMLFTCLDGYQPSIPIDKFVEFASALAFQRDGTQDFSLSVIQDKNKKIDVAPYYLVWDNLKNTRLRSGELNDWPYQLIGVDLIEFSVKFPGISPPVPTSPQVRRGFVAYRQRCLPCHQINGQGGNSGPELNYPVNVTEYFKGSTLRKYILNPKSVRANAQMPGFDPFVNDWDKTVTDILAYVKAMAKKKIPPKKVPE